MVEHETAAYLNSVSATTFHNLRYPRTSVDGSKRRDWGPQCDLVPDIQPHSERLGTMSPGETTTCVGSGKLPPASHESLPGREAASEESQIQWEKAKPAPLNQREKTHTFCNQQAQQKSVCERCVGGVFGRGSGKGVSGRGMKERVVGGCVVGGHGRLHPPPLVSEQSLDPHPQSTLVRFEQQQTESRASHRWLEAADQMKATAPNPGSARLQAIRHGFTRLQDGGWRCTRRQRHPAKRHAQYHLTHEQVCSKMC